MTERPSTPRPALKALTGLRFVAALAVVLQHVLGTLVPAATGPLARLAGHGYLGVSLFFVLSGFILTYTYVDSAESTLHGSRGQFWRARFARIYPVYVVALVLSAPTFVVFRLMATSPSARLDALPALVLAPGLLQAWWPRAACQWNCPGWSLSVEAFFYALFPFVALVMARMGRRAWMAGAGMWIASLMIPVAYLSIRPDGLVDPTRADVGVWLEAVKFLPLVHLGSFVLGIAAGLALIRGEVAWAGTRAFGTVTVVALTLVGITLTRESGVPYLLLHDGLLAPIWVAVILGLATGGGMAGRVLAWRPMIRLGEASYALYLVHLPVYWYWVFASRWLYAPPENWLGGGLQLVAYLVLVITLSSIIFQRIEEPARRALRRAG